MKHDELIARLRINAKDCGRFIEDEAADRIEELEVENIRLTTDIANDPTSVGVARGVIANLKARIKELKKWNAEMVAKAASGGVLDGYRGMAARITELEDPSWVQFIAGAEKWLTKYPPDIFDGSSGDPGPLFVVALRNALAALKEET